MINTEKERAKADQRLRALKIFENRTKVIVESIRSLGIDYDEPLARARHEIEVLEIEIKEFDEMRRAKIEPVSNELISRLPKYLVAMRYQAGWSQLKLARRLGVSPQLMSKYEKNYFNLKLSKVIEVMIVLEAAVIETAAAKAAVRAEAEECSVRLSKTVGSPGPSVVANRAVEATGPQISTH